MRENVIANTGSSTASLPDTSAAAADAATAGRDAVVSDDDTQQKWSTATLFIERMSKCVTVYL